MGDMNSVGGAICQCLHCNKVFNFEDRLKGETLQDNKCPHCMGKYTFLTFATENDTKYMNRLAVRENYFG